MWSQTFVTSNVSCPVTGQDSDSHRHAMSFADSPCLPAARILTSRNSALYPPLSLPVKHRYTHKPTVQRQQQLPDGSLKGTVCDATDVKPSRRGEMPQCVSSESTKRARASGVGGEQGSTQWVNWMNPSNKRVKNAVISEGGRGKR